MPDWPHSPIHRLTEAGAYIVTAATYQHKLYFLGRERLNYLQEMLFSHMEKFRWTLQAWAFLSNHYHFVAQSPEDPKKLRAMLKSLHSQTAIWVNKADGIEGRKVWHQYRDTHLTYEKSFLARLHYVHYNPLHHGLARDATQYLWCSAKWFEGKASPAFCKTVRSFPVTRLLEGDIECAVWE